MKFRNRIMLSFAALFALFLLVITLQIFFQVRSVNEVKVMLGRRMAQEKLVNEADRIVLELRAEVWDGLVQTLANRQLARTILENKALAFFERLRQIVAILPDQAKRAEALTFQFRGYVNIAHTALAEKDFDGFTRHPDVAAKFRENQESLTLALQRIREDSLAAYSDSLAALDRASVQAASISGALALMSAFLAFGLALFLSHRLSRPLDTLTLTAREVAGGNYRIRAGVRPSGEVGVLAEAFDRMLGEIDTYSQRMEELVTERTKKLQQTQNQLIQSEKMSALGVLVSGLAHEINTPLGVGMTASSFLVTHIDDLEAGHLASGGSTYVSELGRVREAAGLIQRNLERAGDLVRSFKMVSVDQTADTYRLIDLSEYIDEIFLSLRPRTRSCGLDLVNQVPRGLIIQSHPGAISQVITALVMNSVIHGYNSHGPGNITVEGGRSSDKVILSVADSGAGMAEESLRHLFEPFFTTRRGAGGTGLGLFIVYNLVTVKLGGTIRCPETPGKGTRFEMELPLR